MISNFVYTNKSFYISNQVKSRFIYFLNIKAINLYIKDLCHLINTLTFTESIIKIMILTTLENYI